MSMQPRARKISKNPMSDKQPTYLTIKQYVLARIQDGTWKQGEAIPGEEALAREFSVSRMTVNRAIRELSDEQIVERVQPVFQRRSRSAGCFLQNVDDTLQPGTAAR